MLKTETPLLAVGTHALFSETVRFARLGVVVIDEQHRFGVLQKQSLRAKGIAPHTLVMTATPIPRTMTLSVYGDLAVSVIDELPAGRLPVETRRVPPGNRKAIEKAIRDAVREGGQHGRHDLAHLGMGCMRTSLLKHCAPLSDIGCDHNICFKTVRENASGFLG